MSRVGALASEGLWWAACVPSPCRPPARDRARRKPEPIGSEYALARRAAVAQNRRDVCDIEPTTLNQIGEAQEAPCVGLAVGAHPCESERGAWGALCPDCGARLPPEPGPLRSWHAARVNDPILSERARALRSPLRHWHLR